MATRVPGWVVVYLRRHAAGLTDMSPAELTSMGPTLSAAASAIENVLEPERVYSLMFGENVPHVHVVLVPRGKDVAPEHRSSALHVNAKLYEDPQRAQEVAERIRQTLGVPTTAA
jgi:diadenosine tetraphosphate (Ap4A) HIT family hydrolase